MIVTEITEAVDMCRSDGRLRHESIGFSRTPLRRPNLRGWGRNKRWDYWGVVTPRFVLGMTVAGLDYAQLSQVYFYDRETRLHITADTTKLGPGAVVLPDGRPPMTVRSDNRGTKTRFLDEGSRTILRLSTPRVEVELSAEPGGECLEAVVPWSDKRFQYTLKELARPVSGTVTVDGEVIDVAAGDSFAVLDRGRGKWPYNVSWNWGAGSGVVDGRRIGLQLGGKWTAGTGVTENGLFVDGRLNYWGDELEWTYDLRDESSPWRVRGEYLDATLTPFHRRHASTNLLVISSSTHQAFGNWSGFAYDNQGTRHALDGLAGWAEEANNRW